MIESRDKSLIPDVFSKAIRLSQLFILPVIGYLLAYGSEVLKLIYGYEYGFAGIYIVLLSISYILYPILVVDQGYFNGVGKTGNTLKTNLLFLLAVLVLAPPTVYLLRVSGGIIALAIAYISSALYSIKLVKNDDLSIEATYNIKIIVTTLTISLLTYVIKILINLNLISELVIGGVIYSVLYTITLAYIGIPSHNDMEFIDRAFRSIPIIRSITYYILRLISILRSLMRRGVY